MILFNTTYCVDDNVAGDFLDFICNTYLPVALESGLYDPLLTELRGIGEPNALTGQPTRTFALQLRIPSQEIFDSFAADVLTELQTFVNRTWGGGVTMFESTLDVIYDPRKK